MKKHIFTILLAATTLSVAAQDTIWIKYNDRFKANTVIDLKGADSIIFSNSSFRPMKDGRTQSFNNYSSLISSIADSIHTGAFMFNDPGLIAWKPLSSANEYNTNYLNPESRWSFARSKESEHFIVFWDKPFGSNPNTSSLPSNMRVDIDDLLKKAEQFYTTNVNKLKMVTVGEGKSYLDKYKMSIYLIYQTEWLATGSGNDEHIGTLWVNPSTCKPVGATIAHEVGHTFQYQIHCDQQLTGTRGYHLGGFRYGYAEGDNPDATGGNAFWEQCAQWQSQQDYPAEAFNYNIDTWLKNYHRHFLNEYMRYANYWLMYYWVQKHGIESYGQIWKESRFPEDPIETYIRLFCDNSLDKFYTNYYEYATMLPNYQYDNIHRYATAAAKNFKVSLYPVADNYYQVGYASCPSTTGINIIKLDKPIGGTEVSADFVGLNPGDALPFGDTGRAIINYDKNTTVDVTTYNNIGKSSDKGWRYGFVSIVADRTFVSPMYSANEGKATYTVPAGASALYFVVVGAPKTYNHHPWDDVENNDYQWPYKVKFTNTAISK